MQEERSNANENITPDAGDAERDATSSETVSDLEKSGKTPSEGSESESSGSSSSSSSPSPDGQFDEPRGGAGPENEAGPM